VTATSPPDAASGRGPLGLDPETLVACVACGLCLPHCPTYRVTDLEIASPRGRIAAMRAIESGTAPIDATFERAMDECVQCRGCEAACPSGVHFGALMEGTRAALATRRAAPGSPRANPLRRAVEAVAFRVVLVRHRVLLAVSWVLWLAQRLHLVPKRVGVPSLRAGDLRVRLDAAAGDATAEVWLFTGCVMDAWQRPVHADALRVLRAGGRRVAVPGAGGDCCGALHEHAGRRRQAQALARRVMASMPGDAPIAVDSAGCGAAMRGYGELLGTPEARTFSARVRDFAELAVELGAPARLTATGRTAVVQDPCHLRHVQNAHGAVRTLLAPAYELRDTDDDGLCCGAGGAYSAVQPELSTRIRDRKARALRAAGASNDVVVCSANPGCAFHLAAAGFTVAHPATLAARALEDT
jgi:glycolate oxidase iron-sulfur subunit